MNIGQRIKAIREAQAMSMNNLARLCNVSQANLSRIESARQQPAFDTLERIIAALGFTLSDFFSVEKPDLEPDSKRLLNSIQALKPDQKRALYAFLEEMKK
jgi:transcriptional regulator with XRE-family HTH domain